MSRRYPPATVALLAYLGAVGPLPAQEAVRLREAFPAGYQYHVSTRVELTGTLTLPPDKPQAAPQSLTVAGSSAIEYGERVVDPDPRNEGAVPKTLRVYRRADLKRTLGNVPQESGLRPEVRRLVILRHKFLEVPFSPDGPLQMSEIDFIRTDVFTPALSGLLPADPVRPGDRWTASPAAVQELTDLETLEEGKCECRLEQVTTLEKRRYARVGFAGVLRGVNEDGPIRRQLEGYLFFDLESNHLSYLYLKGVTNLLDRDGKATGTVEGKFVLTREPRRVPELGDEAIRGLALEPNAENTLLLYDNPDLGLRFHHSRRWRVATATAARVDLADERNGHGVRLTVEPLTRLPTGAQFQAETQTFLSQQKARILRADPPRRVQAAPRELEQFALDAEVAGRRVWLEYYVARQGQGGVAVAARLMPNDLAAVRGDVERIARSLSVTRVIENRK